MRTFIFLVFFIFSLNLNGQVIISEEENTGHPSSILDIISTDKGVLLPRMTSDEIAVIYQPADGLMVYNVGNRHIYVFDSLSVEWKQLQFSTNTIQPWTCGNDFPYEGQVYNTIQLGSNCWMRNNLNVGEIIPYNSISLDNGIIEKQCLDDNPAKCDSFGGYYQWFEAVAYDLAGGDQIQGICQKDGM